MPSAASSGSARSCMSSKASTARARRRWHRVSYGTRCMRKYLRGQAAWLVNYAKRHRAGERVGTSITDNWLRVLVGVDSGASKVIYAIRKVVVITQRWVILYRI